MSFLGSLRPKQANQRMPSMKIPGKHLLLLVGAALTAFTASAGETAVTVSPGIVSEYMFRGVRLGGASFQPAVEVASGSFGAGVWCTTPVAGRVPGQSDPEIDPYAYYTFTLSDHLTLVPACSVYTYPNADPHAGFFKATLEPNVTLNYTVEGVTFSPKLYYDCVLEGATWEFTAAYAMPMESLHTSLNFSGLAGCYTWKNSVKGASPKVTNRGSYCQFGVSLPLQIAKSAKLTLGAAYTMGFNNTFESAGSGRIDNPSAVGRFVGSIGLAFSF
jgi:hypothetical protein